MPENKDGDTTGVHDELVKLRRRVRELEAQEVLHQTTEEQLQDSEERLSAVVNSTSDAIISIDEQGLVTLWNEGALRMFRRSRDEMLGQPITAIMPERLRAGHSQSFQRVVETGQSVLAGRTIEVSGLRHDGTEFPAELTLSVWQAGGKIQFVGIIRDITERKIAEGRLKQLALNDALTGLPNRVLLYDRLDRAITQAKRYKGLLALMYLDLDGFKGVNDRLGHAAGDQVLQEAASRLLSCLRASDTVARMGGDEFSVVLPTIQQPKDAGIVALKIIRAMRLPFQIEESASNLSVCIGITLYPNDGNTAELLLKNADSAMYRAKERGRLRIQFFNDRLYGGLHPPGD
jgi:diguanylate cyclase (GGDEF)-like protein/PAS domain S-box-containing protein